MLDYHGASPCHRAAATGAWSSIEVMLVCGADVSIRTKQGETSEQIAARCGHPKVAERLAEAAATPGGAATRELRDLQRMSAVRMLAQLKREAEVEAEAADDKSEDKGDEEWRDEEDWEDEEREEGTRSKNKRAVRVQSNDGVVVELERRLLEKMVRARTDRPINRSKDELHRAQTPRPW